MILSAEKVRDLLEHPAPNPADRLVISPVLDMDKQLKSGTASVDVRLGQRFHVPLRAKLSQLNLLSSTHQQDLAKYKDDTFVPIGDYFVLHPGQFVLGETLEWVHLPKDLVAFVIGKSTLGKRWPHYCDGNWGSPVFFRNPHARDIQRRRDTNLSLPRAGDRSTFPCIGGTRCCRCYGPRALSISSANQSAHTKR